MGAVRSALYLDFDNVFSGLVTLDPAAALAFAESPSTWLDRMSKGDRRWLVLRCYMNPSGSIPDPRTKGARFVFFKFRSAFTDAGFEVVDCPRLSHTKNGADIRLAIDAVEALKADARYDEFVIASGDSDMTPLLVRLRAADRDVTLVSPSDSAEALRAVADRLVGADELLELVDTRRAEIDMALDPLDEIPEPVEGDVLTEAQAAERFAELVRARYAEAGEPINVSTLAHEMRSKLGPVVQSSEWFGNQGFIRALQSLNLPDLRVMHPFMWDAGRHDAPLMPPVPVEESDPGVITRISRVLKIPTLPSESWTAVYGSLADYVRAFDFNMTEMTRWCRDRLREQGVRANRQTVSIVLHGAAHAGCPLYRQPPPTAYEIRDAFIANTLHRAAASDIDLTADEVDEVRRWLGAEPRGRTTLDLGCT